jgi:hypothetical protein
VIWEHEVAGSNPVAPTNHFKGLRGWRFSSSGPVGLTLT